MAPADAFTAAGLIGAERRVGKSTPWTPHASALRRSVPTFWGILEGVQHEHERWLASLPCPAENLVQRGPSARLDDERHALVPS